jgi:hypothetical protein
MGAVAEQVAATQDILHPTHKQRYRPAIPICNGAHLGRHLQAIGPQDQPLRGAIGLRGPAVTSTPRNGYGRRRVGCDVPNRRRCASRDTTTAWAAAVPGRSSCPSYAALPCPPADEAAWQVRQLLHQRLIRLAVAERGVETASCT